MGIKLCTDGSDEGIWNHTSKQETNKTQDDGNDDFSESICIDIGKYTFEAICHGFSKAICDVAPLKEWIKHIK